MKNYEEREWPAEKEEAAQQQQEQYNCDEHITLLFAVCLTMIDLL